MKRRNFIKTFMKSVFITSLLGKFKPSHLFASEMEISHELPRRPFGETGFEVGIFSLGGQATLEYEGKDDEADKIINRSIDLGVNYIDTSAYYGWDRNGVHLPGVSERYIGKVMRFRRNEVYLASKTLGRTYDEAMRDLETTLKNLQTDHIDLWQVHNVRSKEDLNRWSVEDGAIKAFEKAKNEKIIQHIGITGHKDPFALKYGIEHFPFDTILLSLNAADKHDVSFIDSVLPVAVEKNMGIIGMKVPARGKIFKEGGISSMEQAMGYVLTLPVSTIIVGVSTLHELEENIEIAKKFRRYSEKEMAHLEDLTKPYYEEASFFKYTW